MSARLAAADERISRTLADAAERHATKGPGVRYILKRASVVFHPESEPSVSYGGSSASDAQPSATTSTDQDTSMRDATRETRTRPTQEVTPANSKDHIGGDVAMEKEVQTKTVPDARARDHNEEREPLEVRDAQSSTTEQHVPRRVLGKTTPQEHAVAVTTREAWDGHREKTMSIATVENNTLNWVSTSSAGALDMTHCDFSVRSARDEMRLIVGSSERDVIIGSDKDQNKGCKKDKDHMEFLCELYEAQAARGRYFGARADVRMEFENEVRAKIMAMPGTRTTGGSVHVRIGRMR